MFVPANVSASRGTDFDARFANSPPPLEAEGAKNGRPCSNPLKTLKTTMGTPCNLNAASAPRPLASAPRFLGSGLDDRAIQTDRITLQLA
jgi:hypothetical protein